MGSTSDMNDTVNTLTKELYPCINKMQPGDISEAIGTDFKKWHHKSPVFIDAPTGSGKTTFVYHRLIPHAISLNRTVLLISNRIALRSQQRRNIKSIVQEYVPDYDSEAATDTANIDQEAYYGPVCVVTYQGLPSLLKNVVKQGNHLLEWYNRLIYVVMDEAHFFYSDAEINEECGNLLQKLPKLFYNTVRVYMTATSRDIIELIYRAELNANQKQQALSATENYIRSHIYPNRSTYTISRYFRYYYQNADFSSYRLHFFNHSSSPRQKANGLEDRLQALVDNMKPLPTAENKWLIFIDKKDSGQALNRYFDKKRIATAYIDAQEKQPETTWNVLLDKECIDKAVLIATSVIDCGININDIGIKNIAIFSTDYTSFIQLLGRKRRFSPNEEIDLWVWEPPKKHFSGKHYQLGKQVKLASRLLHCHETKQHHSDTEYYANIANDIWKNKHAFSCDTLFYIDPITGKFSVNLHVLNILKSKLYFNRQFLKNSTTSYRDVVHNWLSLSISTEDNSHSDLVKILDACVGKDLQEDDFTSVREAIVSAALKSNIPIPHIERKNSFAATTLNPLLLQLHVPYTVKRTDYLWSIQKQTQ